MRYRFQSGVNLGSWFVTEKWISPSLYKCAHDGEKGDLAILRGYGNSSQGIQSARARLEEHWDKWITAGEFAKMHNEYQINAVRIPIGYWNLPGARFTKDTPFEPWTDVYKNCWKYVRRAIKMAADNEIGVVLDLHGAYGSQNGKANTGFNGFDTEFFQSNNEKRTKEALVWIANDLKDVTNFVGIELLNEPEDKGGLGWWYKTTAQAIHDIGGNAANLPVYFGNPPGPSNIAESVSSHSFTAFDVHEYYTFTNRNKPEPEILKNVLGHNFDRFMNLKNSTKNRLVIGEWSCALDPGSLSGSKSNHAAERAEFCQAQIQSYRNASSAMFFWSYKYENCEKWGGWCFDKMWGQYIKNYGGYGMQSVDSSNLPNVPFIPALGQSQLNFQGYKDGMNIARKLASQQPSTPLGFNNFQD
ncbi:Exo-B-1,3-glucanase (GH 5 family)-like protein [Malassezia sympodialis ATCC 42132]|uniref:Exo-B-1,3-glucanase (GH 5 family)-like protein n=1 Tax=Malassezia sympodialis (strain ATCC 42132) TaxID=1230383 RepID=UPI0002C25515|nr:Exo-B-1,3-glucanase (GH 5 family)-like protein [Malassezia sympodialis ATCC 42132]CCV00701.1 Exo-B-1,3-glucanase (GH 5 family)-like protein [Malassezia sympodialis ATCC 42132]|eukprot:XP_018741881.1 Exo-B-1,3-glucanase (GH 5 family)-like protein [Malassezia sympodialis ATCC 42132]